MQSTPMLPTTTSDTAPAIASAPATASAPEPDRADAATADSSSDDDDDAPSTFSDSAKTAGAMTAAGAMTGAGVKPMAMPWSRSGRVTRSAGGRFLLA